MDSKIDSYGRILIPQELRDRLGFSSDTPVELEVNDQELLVRRKQEAGLIERYGLLVYSGGGVKEDPAESVRKIRKGRDEKLDEILNAGNRDR